MIEIWKDIKDYEGLYQVSNFGRVRSLDHYSATKCKGVICLIKGKFLTPTLQRTGYLSVCLSKNGTVKRCLVHRLVAEAFIPNPHNHPTVDHINRIRTDNCVENLRWASWELQAENNTSYDVSSKPVLQYTLDMVFVKEYPSIGEASRQTGIDKANISACCRGKIKSAGHYKWYRKVLT